ncbi:unnamed protein product [Spirodela intermedia]|uniref:Smr domain-containing protein n=1 Tax=Spirodela intermedia TaxID=51605 RepID=A0A7I8ITB7_SPIIN|nr:unnamed protein product [Spirodela intermedia]CAA6660194.1 unnamed protein product [Spirodela intermedia]
MAGSHSSQIEGKRVKSPGWTAFDRKMRRNECPEPKDGNDPFPPVSDPQGPNLGLKHWSPIRSFSSVVHASVDSQSREHRIKLEDLDERHASKPRDDADHISMETNALSSIERLKSIHGWADEGLIWDILAEVGNDEDKATTLLGAMVSPIFSSKDTDPKESMIKLMSLKLVSAPVEPDWEEDDVYLSHRKDAIRMMRSAANHSRAAANAFQRGDHHSARQLSLKAQEKRVSAEKLNTAAQEILRIRNSTNDMWKLDLHGLHASEAVKMLTEHLSRIETHLSAKHEPNDGPLVHSSLNSRNKMAGQAVLQVITGTGNHSRGPAALPAAVRGFLIENRYRFDDVRAGVIAVRPKFRHRSMARDDAKSRP